MPLLAMLGEHDDSFSFPPLSPALFLMKLTKDNKVSWYYDRVRELSHSIGIKKALLQAQKEVSGMWKTEKK